MFSPLQENERSRTTGNRKYGVKKNFKTVYGRGTGIIYVISYKLILLIYLLRSSNKYLHRYLGTYTLVS